MADKDAISGGGGGHTAVEVLTEEKTTVVMEKTKSAPADALAAEARQAAATEQNMSVLQCIKTYPKAIGWSLLISTTIIMEGYDLSLLGHLFGSPVFNKAFGEWHEPSGRYVVSAGWMSALTNAGRAGEIFGLLMAGWMQDRYGYKKTLIFNLFLMKAFIFILFFAPNVQILVVGEVFCGLPWGAFQAIAPAYASEVAPVNLRPYLTTYINMCWVIGQFFSAAVNYSSVDRTDEWAYRLPFAIQWVWPVVILMGAVFAPESPWWHIRHGDREGAKKALLRLTSANQPGFNADETIAMIEHTNEMEKAHSEGTSYLDLFKGVDLRRTEVTVVTWICQVMTGSNLMSYFSYFMIQAGLDPANSMAMAMGNSALGLVGTAGSWFLMAHVGRRKIQFGGVCTQFCILIIVGSLSFAKSNASVWAIGAMLIIFTFVYDFTIGPVTFCLVSELSSTRLRSKSIVTARAAYNLGNIFVNVMTNYQLNTAAWNWGARTAYFWAGTCAFCVVWVFFRLPEPKGRTYAELDLLFEHKISARKFHKTKIDPYSDEHPIIKRSPSESE